MQSNEKPTKITVLATGGTIAGCGTSADVATSYRAGVLGVDALLDAVPGIRSRGLLRGEQFCNIDSKDMTEELWLRLARRCNAIFSRGEAESIVLLHGTDTLEETAYFLHLTVRGERPIVLTGAMRPATALSADGPRNLFDAVCVAASPVAVGKGVLVVMNGEIHAARDVRKTHTLGIDAFHSPKVGALGYVYDHRPVFCREPLRRRPSFDVTSCESLPDVRILWGHAGDDGKLIRASVQLGAEGIVYAGMGNGSIHEAAEKALREAAARGVAVVRSSRVGSGPILSATPSPAEDDFIEGDTLCPQQARILLQLALLQTRDLEALRRIFQTY